MALKLAFGISTRSIYENEAEFWRSRPGFAELLGETEEASSLPQKDIDIVKTHDGPEDSGPAIYVIRDGRSAIVSHYHYIQNVSKEPADIRDIICGKVWPMGWSQHVTTWDPMKRKDTIIIKYEDMLQDLPNVMIKIGDFIKRDVISMPDLEFSRLNSLFPEFFNVGRNNKSAAELADHIDLFWDKHGETMQVFGYE